MQDPISPALPCPPGECPLCGSRSSALFYTEETNVPWHLYSPESPRGRGLRFFRCLTCDLIVKDPAIRPSAEQARRHYEKHNNDPHEPGYRAHLLRLLAPTTERLAPGARGLDFGCGPSLSLELLAREAGFDCSSFDPTFQAHRELLRPDSYDFVMCSEVIEHFEKPADEFRLLRQLLKPEGILGVMTQHPPESFPDWWYQRDPTHVCFYSEATFGHIARIFGLTLLSSQSGVAVFQLPPVSLSSPN